MHATRHHRTLRLVPVAIAALLVLCLGGERARAEKVKVAKPQLVEFQTKQNYVRHSGRVVAYDDAGFDLQVRGFRIERFAWNDLDVKTQYVVWRNTVDRKDGPAHVELGRRMLGLPGGEAWAEKAFAAALKLDPKLKPKVAEARESPLPPPPADAAGEAGGDEAEAGDEAGGQPVPPELEHLFGGMLARQQREGSVVANVAKLTAFADETQKRMGKRLGRQQTMHFLLYSDLPEDEAKRWAGLLDRMHARLCELFDLPAILPFWRGKALVFVFQSKDDYVRFQREMHDTDAATSAGMCHTYPDGFVHIAFYRQAEELQFAHVLVHESVHGFLHRYKTQAALPSWAEEGLAEWIADELVPRPGRDKVVLEHARARIREHNGVGDLFDAEPIEGWQYPVAEMLTTFMIERGKRRYVEFVEAVKAGEPWEQALEAAYRMNRAKLLKEFSKAMGV